MTEEKKSGKIAEPVDEKKSDINKKGTEESIENKTEAKEAVDKEKTKEEPEEKIEQKAKSDVKADKKKPAVKKEKKKAEEKEKVDAEEEVKAETKSDVEDKTDEKENIAPEEREVIEKNINNLNFYAELRTDLPLIKSGDILKIFYRVVEGGKERIQLFEGTVIALKNSGISKTITVRKTSFGISIERIFPLNSKLVQKIEVIKHSRVRRAKLYYLRKLKGKAARLKELR